MLTSSMMRQHQHAKALMRWAITLGLLLYGYLLIVQQGAVTKPCHNDGIAVPPESMIRSGIHKPELMQQQQQITTITTANSNYFNLPANLSTHDIIQHMHRRKRTVLMFSPYDFSTGGGEKYFLEVARFFQTNDYTLTISSFSGNYCQDKNCIIQTAKTLDVNLSNDFFYFTLDYGSGRQWRDSEAFDIYYEMGNSKFIQYGAPKNAFTIYQCQFPFDTDNDGTELNLQDLQMVDVVIVNSEYTKLHYLDQTQEIFSNFLQRGGTFPNVEIVHPPVSLLEVKNTDETKPNDITVISMLGRIFQGRQSKGHMSAVQAVRNLYQELRLKYGRKRSFELHIIGNVHPGFDAFAKNLTKLSKGLPIVFHLSVSREELRETLAKSHFIWHLTGIDAENDPASNEHFGISLVEAMSVGAIPIHFNKGGAPEASKGCGYEISDVNSLVQQTMQAMQLSKEEFARKSAICQNAAKSFSIETFGFNLERLLVRSRMTRTFFQNSDMIPHLQSRDPVVASKQGKYSAYIYVHAPSIHVPYAVRNIMKTLGEEWNLYVGVQPKMRKYVEPLFANVQNARFLEHSQLKGLVTDYSKMMMSTEFWDLFDTEHVLIFQPDCVMFYNDMDHFVSLGAPLLGAPWCLDNEVFEQKIVHWRVGNGGFSLRRKSWMKRCIESEEAWRAYNALKKIHGTKSGPLSADNEDIFFNVCVKELMEWEDLWKYEAEAAHFAVEVPCGREDGYMNQGIMAGHAFWYYTTSEEHQKLLNGQPPDRSSAIWLSAKESIVYYKPRNDHHVLLS